MKTMFASLKNKINTDKLATLTIFLLVAILLIIGGVMISRNYNFEGWVATVAQRAEDIETSFFSRNNHATSPLLEDEDDSLEEPVVIGVSSASYTEIARAGEGLTHLARRALSSYLSDSGQSLSDAQRIYAEDYIQLRIPLDGSRWLEIGQEVEISSDLIQEAIEMANSLGSAELGNLQQYVGALTL
jgi:hypothetical protein